MVYCAGKLIVHYVVEKRRIGLTSMATKITETAILANSRYEED